MPRHRDRQCHMGQVEKLDEEVFRWIWGIALGCTKEGCLADSYAGRGVSALEVVVLPLVVAGVFKLKRVRIRCCH